MLARVGDAEIDRVQRELGDAVACFRDVGQKFRDGLFTPRLPLPEIELDHHAAWLDDLQGTQNLWNQIILWSARLSWWKW